MSLEQCRLSKDEWSMIAVDNSSQLDASEVERIMEWIDSLPSNIHVAFAAASTSPLITILQYRYACKYHLSRPHSTDATGVYQ
uniref:hypothetical protein n=1 Tax=Bacteroides faecichinchillae TaxID=871325 RepID=UPI0011DDB6D9